MSRPGSHSKRPHPAPLAFPPHRDRRALTHVGGQAVVEGDRSEDRQVLEAAIAVTPDEDEVMSHVHGFHSYPARMHPDTAARLIQGLTRQSGRVLDPFAGSGTVPVETRLGGRHAIGIDANPLAVELAWLKTRGFSPSEMRRLADAGARVVDHATERRIAKAGPTRRYGREDRELFDIHVLLELDGLRSGIEQLRSESEQRTLGLVLSAILTKVSRQAGDTSSFRLPRRLAGGYATLLFSRKLEELLARITDFSALLPPRAPVAMVGLGDARSIPRVRDRSIDLVVTSPPYPGVYDYFDQHATRLRWLGLTGRFLEQKEIGSRRKLSSLARSAAIGYWDRDFGQCLREMRRVLAPGGTVALVMADSVVGGAPLYADEMVVRLGRRAGLAVQAWAAQPRPYFHAPTAAAFTGKPRREWVLLLRPMDRGAASV